jgi:hypothetical protein
LEHSWSLLRGGDEAAADQPAPGHGADIQLRGRLLECELLDTGLGTVEVLTLAGLRRYFVFLVIELNTRRVQIAGIHPQPRGEWMAQTVRNLTDVVDGSLRMRLT